MNESHVASKDEVLLRKREVAAIFAVSKRTVENWVKRRGLVAIKAGGAIRFSREAVEAFKKGGQA